MGNYTTNRHLLGEAKRRGISVVALAAHLGISRQTLSTRLNSLDRPSKEWVAQVLDALDTIENGMPTA